MNFLKYLNISKPALDAYAEAGWLQVAHHDTFPLDMYTYTRKTVYERNWVSVTSKCRGIIVNRDTMEVLHAPEGNRWESEYVEYKGKFYRQTLDVLVTSEYGKRIMKTLEAKG
jgi:hypothetical protein